MSPVESSGQSVSVILVAFNAADVIADTLTAVERALPEAEIVVVDNGSCDGSAEVARDVAPDVALVQGHGNVGFGAGVNLGVRAASGELIFILNVDATVTSVDGTALKDLAGATELGLATCAVTEDGRTGFPVFRQRGWRREVLWILERAFLTPRELRVRRRVVPVSTDRAWLGGAALVARREEFLGLGGFDERYFLYSEDRDLSHSYARAGLPLRATDAIVVEHRYADYSPSTAAEQVAWSLLSLVEHSGKWGSEAQARSAAVLAMRALAAIEVLARFTAWLPGLGERAGPKIGRARAVRKHVHRVISGEAAPPPSYPIARRCFPRATGGG